MNHTYGLNINKKTNFVLEFWFLFPVFIVVIDFTDDGFYVFVL